MGELLSLRAYGRAVLRSDGPSFRVQWSEDSETITWNDGKVTMEEFRNLCRHAYQSVVDSLARLMYGLQPAIWLQGIRDDISSTAQGYSFVQDPANHLTAAYLELSSRACLDPIDGLMSSERWNMDAVSRYLKAKSNLPTQIMLVM